MDTLEIIRIFATVIMSFALISMAVILAGYFIYIAIKLFSLFVGKLAKYFRIKLFSKKGLFLDDERDPSDITWVKYAEDYNWTVVRTPEQFLRAIETRNYSAYSFDHDIGDKDVTGYSMLRHLCDKFIEENKVLYAAMYFHSQNSVGVRNMASFWYSYCKNFHRDSENNCG